MENLFLKYMTERNLTETKKAFSAGPVITISRECGCSASCVAEKLTNRINTIISDPAKKWKWVNKEILNRASEDLKVNPQHVKDHLDSGNASFFDDFVASFTEKYYVHDSKIRKVIEEVVRHIAIQGKVVIVGRGSDALAIDIPLSLKVKLYAPLHWRIGVISERDKITHEEAHKIVEKLDTQRSKFRDSFHEKTHSVLPSDIEFNCAKFTQEEIVEMILKVAELKGLF
ncbi:MAG: cytidylate kinase-like family protein [Mariniphaga sp.]